MATMTSREFNRDIARAKRAAEAEPLIIVDQGRRAYVLMRYETYRHLSRQRPSIRELLSHPESEEIAFEPPRMGGDV